jgi:hypothetical protein
MSGTIDIASETECTCLDVVTESSGDAGCYLGGRPPVAAALADTGAAAQYLATIPFPHRPEKRCSLFIAPFGALIKSAREWQRAELVVPVVHPPGPRVISWDRLQEPSSEHGLKAGDAVRDEYVGDDGQGYPLERIKMGGRPAFRRHHTSAMDEYRNLRAQGFQQLVQLDWFGFLGSDVVQGTWPFGDGVFSLLMRRDGDRYDWRWLWQL